MKRHDRSVQRREGAPAKPLIDWESGPEWLNETRSATSSSSAFPDSPPVLSCRNLVKVYPSATGRVLAVRGVDLDIGAGVATAVVGPSGSGKSSLLRLLAALDEPTAGVVEIDGIDLFSLRPKDRARQRAALVTHVHQRPTDNLLGHLTARQQLIRILRRAEASGHARSGPSGPVVTAMSDEASVDEVLEALGLQHRAHQLPAELSGGEQQRLSFARAAVAGHRLVIADEPSAQLDGASVVRILEAIDELIRRGTTVVVATHDRRILPSVDEIVRLRDGVVASVSHDGVEEAVIDRSGRLQLPHDIRQRFPKRRAVLTWDQDAESARITPP